MDYIDYDNDFVFMTDKTGNLTGGGFKIQSELLKHNINKPSSENNQRGGNTQTMPALKDLVVPAGLFYQNTNTHKDYSIKYNNQYEQLDDNIYSKLLELVSPDKKKLHNIKTRRNKESKKIRSRKIKHV
jgi:hypothetical protein